MVPGPATLAFTRSLLETASGHLPRPADSETLGMSSRNLSYTSPLDDSGASSSMRTAGPEQEIYFIVILKSGI